MIEAVGRLKHVQISQITHNPLLERVQLLHLVSSGGVGLGVVEHWLLLVHQRQETRIEVWSRAGSAPQPSLVLCLELRPPPAQIK